MARPLLLLTGAAEGLGAEIARTFAQAGHDVLGLSRTDRASAQIAQSVAQGGGSYTYLACDVTQAAEVAAALGPCAGDIGVLIHNAHVLAIKPLLETTPDEFEHARRVACLGAMIAAQAVLPQMTARGGGTIIFTGATAGLRGAAKFSAFASAKFALRGLAQSLAREFGPKGIHVAHTVLDGLIDEAQSDRRFGDASSTRMDPRAVAQAYLDLAQQPPSAWTHEMDLRPFCERC
jgi:NAD(P)-dependent dehydrogenase (short-subunit alcohol dehydrogenase family)